MSLTRSTLAAIALSALTVACTEHAPAPPTSPSVPNSSPEVPAPPSSSPTPSSTDPNAPPGSPTQPNPSSPKE
jgi:hypothetical protein